MVLEVAILDVKPGMQAEFELAFAAAQRIIDSMPGYLSHQLLHCLENDSRYLLLVRWETLEAHTVGFRQSAEYQQWRKLLHHFYEPFPTVEHYRELLNGPAPDATFWHNKWETGDIGFHEGRPNAFLEAHFAALQMPAGSRVLLPLCGKTRDIAWLLAKGFRIVGVELSELAINELFSELGLQPVMRKTDPFLHYSAAAIDIFVGDFFALGAAQCGTVHAVYDRAALIALPGPVRKRYAAHLVQLSGAAPQLLVSCEYDQTLMDGPPYSVPPAEIQALYGSTYKIQALAQQPVAGGLKGKVPATESAWLLRQ